MLDQGVIHRHRVDPRRLHRHVRDTLTRQPTRGITEYAIKRLEGALDRRPAVRPVTRQPHSHRDHILTNVDSSAPLV